MKVDQIQKCFILIIIFNITDILINVFILMHGEAGTQLSSNINDGLRSLTDAGRKEVLGIAKGLQKIGVKFDIIASTPLKRAHEETVYIYIYIYIYILRSKTYYLDME